MKISYTTEKVITISKYSILSLIIMVNLSPTTLIKLNSFLTLLVF